MAKDPAEWLKQANYDIGAADAMFSSGRYIYSVFMCHLSIEKALKGLYMKRLKEEPPKIHDLVFLLKKTEPSPPDDMKDFIYDLNNVSVPTRYPDDLERMMKNYDKERTKGILNQTGEVLKWLTQLY
jgi:HEPN domain-containing protein